MTSLVGNLNKDLLAAYQSLDAHIAVYGATMKIKNTINLKLFAVTIITAISTFPIIGSFAQLVLFLYAAKNLHQYLMKKEGIDGKKENMGNFCSNIWQFMKNPDDNQAKVELLGGIIDNTNKKDEAYISVATFIVTLFSANLASLIPISFIVYGLYTNRNNMREDLDNFLRFCNGQNDSQKYSR